VARQKEPPISGDEKEEVVHEPPPTVMGQFVKNGFKIVAI
jgi:hypothetical protein